MGLAAEAKADSDNQESDGKSSEGVKVEPKIDAFVADDFGPPFFKICDGIGNFKIN